MLGLKCMISYSSHRWTDRWGQNRWRMHQHQFEPIVLIMLASVASNGGRPYSPSFWVCELFINKKGDFSCGFINNKYGLIFTKLFRGRKEWQLRHRLHGNCKEVINKAWSADIWKCDSQGNENNLTKYYPSPRLTWGQLWKEMSVTVSDEWHSGL